MKFIPYKSLDNIHFDYSIQEVKNIFKDLDLKVLNRVELDRTFPSLNIVNANLFITFKEDSSSIRTITVKRDVFFDDINLFKEKINNLYIHFSKKDASLSIDDEGSLLSEKYGFVISRESIDSHNEVLLFSEDYLNEDHISPEDIIKYYLG